MKTAALFPQPIYYSFIHSQAAALWWLQYVTGQDRIYGVMFCMCIDRGCVGTSENKGV